jgi:integrase
MAHIRTRQASDGARYDVRYVVNGIEHSDSFRSRSDAESRLTRVRADELAGLIPNPRGGERLLGEYADQWLDDRLVKGKPLTPATRFGYEGLLRRNLRPTFGKTKLRQITPERVRTWHAKLTSSVGPDQAAKSYRLLRAIMMTAASDSLVARNPCVIKGAGIEHADEQPMLKSATVVRLATSIDPSFRCLVLVAGLVGLRTGELLGLTRKDVDLLHRVLHVKRQSQEISGRRTITEPKTQAGIRSLSLPAALVAELTHHLDTYAAPGPDGAVFTGRSGLPVRRADLGEAWHAALEAEGLSGLRVHDLRHHAATTFARKPDVTLKELMAAIGHASPVAALRYQHATEERGRELADYMDNIITNARADEPPTAGVVRMGSPKAKRDARGMQAPAKT